MLVVLSYFYYAKFWFMAKVLNRYLATTGQTTTGLDADELTLISHSFFNSDTPSFEKRLGIHASLSVHSHQLRPRPF